jgi:hypothetical protein
MDDESNSHHDDERGRGMGGIADQEGNRNGRPENPQPEESLLALGFHRESLSGDAQTIVPRLEAPDFES